MGKRLWLFFAACVCAVSMTFAQTTVTGKVVDAQTGEPVVGASVLVKGTTQGIATDVNGNFTLQNVPSAGRLKVSYIGMKDTEVAVKPKLRIRMEPESLQTDEVLVVAYGSQKKASFTGAASTVKGEALENLQISNISKALEGSVAGVQIASSSGTPGSEASIRIRGIGSISADQNPLIVLDGVPYDGALSSIPTQDIESLTILKDAAANSLYGSRGANGVIMVTTKSGQSGNVKIDFNATYGFNARGVSNYDIISDAGEYYEMAYEAIRNQLAGQMGYAAASQYASENLISQFLKYNKFKNIDDTAIIDPVTGKLNPNAKTYKWGDDWTKDPFENGTRQEYTIGISGGSADTKAYASLGYLDDEGYMVNSGFKRYNGRLKVDQMVGQYIRVGGSIGYTHTDMKQFGEEGSNYSNIFFFSQAMAPIFPVYLYDANGDLWLDEQGKRQYDFGREYTRPNASEQNPLATAEAGLNRYQRDYITSRGYFEASFLNDFKFTANLGYDVRNNWSTEFMTPIGGDAKDVNGRGEKTTTRTASLDAQELLEWAHTYGDHGLHFQLGHENQKMDHKYIYGHMTQYTDFSNPEFSNAAAYQNLNSYTYEIARDAYFLRGDYNFADRYYLNASIRRDGSSIYSKDNRWGTFWAVGASWRMKEEAWLKDVKWVDNLKVKASYGTQGNDNILNQGIIHAYADQYSVDRVDGSAAFSKSLRGNPDLTWEKSKNFNIGFEAGLWNRFDIEFDFFVKKVEDMMYQSPLPRSEGNPSYIWRNEMDMKNTGIELTLGGDIIKNNDLTWHASFNLTHYKNKLTKLPASKPKELYPDGYAAGNYWRSIGGSLYDYYLYEYAGVDPETGAPRYNKYADHYYNNDGERITAEEAEALGEGNYKFVEDEWDSYVNATSDTKQRRIGKSAFPSITGGFGTSVEYKGFDFSVQTAFQLGGWVRDSFYASLMSTDDTGANYHKDLFNRWTPTNTTTDIPKLVNGSQTAYIDATSDYFLTKASYFSLRNVTLGYTVPKFVTSKWGVDKLRVYLAGDNIWLLSARKGLDPRQSFSGTTGYVYSAISSYSIGVNLSF